MKTIEEKEIIIYNFICYAINTESEIKDSLDLLGLDENKKNNIIKDFITSIHYDYEDNKDNEIYNLEDIEKILIEEFTK